VKLAIFLFGVTIAMVAALLAVRTARSNTAMRVAKTTAYLMCFTNASRDYFRVYGEWPRSIQAFDRDGNPRGIVFVAWMPTNDAWGGPFVYNPFDPARGYGSVASYGRDGQPGGSGPDADLEFRFGP
jgi:hypothetical protein